MQNDMQKSLQGTNDYRKPQKIRAWVLLTPLLATILYTILVSEQVWRGILSLNPQNKSTFADVTHNPGWQFVCTVVAIVAGGFSIGTVNMLLYRSWTYVRTLLLILVPAIALAAVVCQDGVDWKSVWKISSMEGWTFAARANWIWLMILWIMILSGDELEGRLGYVTGNRTEFKKPLGKIGKRR